MFSPLRRVWERYGKQTITARPNKRPPRFDAGGINSATARHIARRALAPSTDYRNTLPMLHRSHGSDGNSGYAIRHVVHRTGWMIDAVATTTRGATLQSAKLTDKAERKSFLAARSPNSPLCCCQLRKDQTMSTQNSITAVDAEAAELDATRAVYDMLKPLGCEAQTRGSRPCLLPSSSGSAETRSAKHFDHQLTFFARPTTSWRSANELTPRCYLAPAKRES
jgi:hypothetical protein